MSNSQGNTNSATTTPADAEQQHRFRDLDESTVDQIHYFISIASYVLLIVSNVRYNFGHRSPWDDGHQSDVLFTPFTASGTAVVIFWLVSIIAQFVYLTKFFKVTPRLTNLQFAASNLLLLLWSYLFARGYYVVAELVVLLNFLQLLAGYVLVGTYRFRPLANYLGIHGPAIVLPLLWSHYLVFWDGAVIFGARNLLSRLVANILIWEFLLVPGVLLVITGDYLLGFASAWIAFSIGLGQLFTKVFALQWIFAFTIAVVLLLASLSFAFVQPSERIAPPALTELRQRTTRNETAPLLTDH